MKYLHTIIKESNDIIQCFSLSGGDDLYLVYPYRVDYCILGNSIEVKDTYRSNKKIRQSILFEGAFILVFSDSSINVMKSSPNWQIISQIMLCDNADPLRNPVSLIGMQFNDRSVVFASYFEVFFYVSFQNCDSPHIQRFEIAEVFFKDVSSTNDINVFAFLGKKSSSDVLLFINTKSKDIIQKIFLNSDYHILVSMNFNESTLFFLFSDLYVDFIERGTIFDFAPLRSKPNIAFSSPSGDLYIQTMDSVIYRMVFSDKSVSYVCSLPLLRHCSIFNNIYLFCVDIHFSYFLIKFSSLNQEESNNSQVIQEFKSEPLSLITDSLEYNNHHILCGGRSDNSFLTTMTDTLPFNLRYVSDGNGFSMDKDESRSLSIFSFSKDNIILYSPKKIISVFDSNVKSYQGFIAAGTFKSKDTIVLSNGILFSDKLDSRFFSIISTYICQDIIIIQDSEFNVSIIGDSDIIISSCHFSGPSCFCFGHNHIFGTESINSKFFINIYSFNLDFLGHIACFSSNILKMIYCFCLNSIFVSLKSGDIVRISLLETDVKEIVTIYHHESNVEIRNFQEGILIYGRSLVYFDGKRHWPICLPKRIISFCSTETDIYILTPDLYIYHVDILSFDKSLCYERNPLDLPPKKIDQFDNVFATICRTNNLGSSLYVFRNNNAIVSTFDLSIKPISICFYQENRVFIGFLANPCFVSSFVIDYDQDCINFEQKYELTLPSYSITRFRNSILVSSGPILNIFDNEKGVMSKLLSVPTEVSIVRSDNSIIWVADRIKSVFAYSVSKGIQSIVLIAYDYIPRSITSMSIFDNSTLIIGDKYGNLCFLKLPNDIIFGHQWRFVYDADCNRDASYLEIVAECLVNDTVTSILKSNKIIKYTTLGGEIGALVPISDTEFISLSAFKIIDQNPNPSVIPSHRIQTGDSAKTQGFIQKISSRMYS